MQMKRESALLPNYEKGLSCSLLTIFKNSTENTILVFSEFIHCFLNLVFFGLSLFYKTKRKGTKHVLLYFHKNNSFQQLLPNMLLSFPLCRGSACSLSGSEREGSVRNPRPVSL